MQVIIQLAGCIEFIYFPCTFFSSSSKIRFAIKSICTYKHIDMQSSYCTNDSNNMSAYTKHYTFASAQRRHASRPMQKFAIPQPEACIGVCLCAIVAFTLISCQSLLFQYKIRSDKRLNTMLFVLPTTQTSVGTKLRHSHAHVHQ